MDFEKMKEYAPAVLRIGLALVFLWFGTNQVFFTEDWLGYAPSFVTNIINENIVIMANGIFEIVFGVLLLIGLFTRLSAFLLAVHLIGITFSLGYNAVAVRDFGLTLAAFAVFLFGPDRYTLDRKLRKIN